MIRPLYSFKSVDIAYLISNGTGGTTAPTIATAYGYNFYTGASQPEVRIGNSDLSFGNPSPFNFKGSDGKDMSSHYSAYFEDFDFGTGSTKFPSAFNTGVGATGSIRAILIGGGGGGGAGGGGGLWNNPPNGNSRQQTGGGGGGGGGGALTQLNKTQYSLGYTFTYSIGNGGIGGIGSKGKGGNGNNGNVTKLSSNIVANYISASEGGCAGSNDSQSNGAGGAGGGGGGKGNEFAPGTQTTPGVDGSYGSEGNGNDNQGGNGGYTPSVSLYGLQNISVARPPAANGIEYGQGGGGGTASQGSGGGSDGGDGAPGYLRIYYLLD